VFKRFRPQVKGRVQGEHKELQRGTRGIFVGFPDGQAGWLIFVHDKIAGSHLVVLMDVVFDQYFLSGLTASINGFDGAQPTRKIGHSVKRPARVTEQTGDVTNLATVPVSHWGDTQMFEVDHQPQLLDGDSKKPGEVDDVIDGDSSDNDLVDIDDDVRQEGSVVEDGLRRSARVQQRSVNETGFCTQESCCENEKDLSTNEIFDTNAVDFKKSDNFSTDKLDFSKTDDSLATKTPLSTGDSSAHNTAEIKVLQEEYIHQALDFNDYMFNTIEKAAEKDNVDIGPYLPEPRNLQQIKQCPEKIQSDWVKTVQKEVKFLVDNETFQRGKKPNEGDEVIPAIFVYKAKITSKGYLDKLKARCVARGDLQEKSDPNDIWAPCVFARTSKVFVSQAAKRKRIIKQLDFVGAFCQGKMQKHLFLQLPKEYIKVLPEYKELFADLLLMAKLIYGTDFVHRVFSDDLKMWILTNKEQPFIQSEVDPALYIYRNAKGDRYLFLICYVDDCCYFGSDKEIEEQLGKVLKQRFNLELQGHAHWFLGTRLYCEKDNSYIIDQETYAKHLLNRYCGKDSHWGLPPMQDTPAPVDYIYSKANRPSSDEEHAVIKKRFPVLSMASAISSLLYIALNTRSDILWIVNKLAKSSIQPGIKDFEVLLHCFGYLRKYPALVLKYYANIEESPISKLCQKYNVDMTELVGFTDSLWQDCPDTGPF
jgi:hypothetical protein